MAKVRLSEAMTEYIEFQQARRRARATVQADLITINKFIRFTGDLLVSSLTPDHVRKFFYGEGGQMREHDIAGEWKDDGKPATRPGVGPASHNHYRSRLMAFLTWCYNEGYHRRNNLMSKVVAMKVPDAKRQRPAPKILLSLMDAAETPRDRAWICAAINTALRSSELKSLTVDDLDLDSGFIYVTIGKTGDQDDMPITADLDTELRRWLIRYATDLGRPLEPDDYVFPARRGGLISHYDENRQPVRTPFRWVPKSPATQTAKIVQKALAKIGLPTIKEGTHTIRRAVALAYFDMVAGEQGDVAALRETAALLNHKSLATTEHYLGMTAEKNRRNKRLRGKPFLSALVPQGTSAEVVQLHSVAEGE